EVCAEAGDATAALKGALRERPALCLVDAGLRGGGIPAAGRISSRVPEAEVVVLADKPDESEALEAVRAGASGYLQKNMNPEAFSRALRGALNGEPAFPRALLAPVLEEFRARHERRRVRLPARKHQADARRSAGTALDVEAAAEQPHPLAHSYQTEPATLGRPD